MRTTARVCPSLRQKASFVSRAGETCTKSVWTWATVARSRAVVTVIGASWLGSELRGATMVPAHARIFKSLDTKVLRVYR